MRKTILVLVIINLIFTMGILALGIETKYKREEGTRKLVEYCKEVKADTKELVETCSKLIN